LRIDIRQQCGNRRERRARVAAGLDDDVFGIEALGLREGNVEVESRPLQLPVARRACDADDGAPGWTDVFGAVKRLEKALAEPDAALPVPSLHGDGPPPASRWPDRDPIAAGRLTRARAAVGAIAAEHGLPVENLLSPELLRRVAWTPPEPHTTDAVADALSAGGARSWQVGLTAEAIATAMAAAEDDPVPG